MFKNFKRNWKNASKSDRVSAILTAFINGIFAFIIVDIWNNVRK